MNAVSNALIDLRYTIGEPILNLAFRNVNGYKDIYSNLDDNILSTVIRPRVMKDCNLVGGIEIVLSVYDAEIRYQDEKSTVYYFPKELTDGKSIISALNLLQGTPFNREYQNYFPSNVDSVAMGQNMMNNIANHSIVQTSRLEVIGENTIYVGIPTQYAMYEYMRVEVENDENLSNISPRSFRVFSKLVELAVKSYIYLKMVIEADKGILYGGHELGKIMEIIEGWSDAEQMYIEQLQLWSKVSKMNDATSMGRYVKQMLGNTL